MIKHFCDSCGRELTGPYLKYSFVKSDVIPATTPSTVVSSATVTPAKECVKEYCYSCSNLVEEIFADKKGDK